MTEKKLKLSYSQCTQYLRCKKRWMWIYKEDLAPKLKTFPLKVGDVTGRVLRMYDLGELTMEHIANLTDYVKKLYPEEDDLENYEVALEAARLVNGYIAEHEDSTIEVISPEMHLLKDFGEFELYARVDAMAVSEDSRKWRLERKTAARYDSRYVAGYRNGLQTGISMWLLEDLYPEKVSGTIYDMLIKTKVPQFPRELVTTSNWRVKLAKETVEGVVRSIMHGDYAPSMDCDMYNKDCSYSVLCRNDTPHNRETWFTSRRAQYEHSKSID